MYDRAKKYMNKGWDPIPPPGKRDQISMGCVGGQDENPDVCPYINTLKCELANSYYWSGNCLFDWFIFVGNWHPLLGILLSHPNHPWTKKERLFMLLVSLSVTMVPSAFIGSYFHYSPVGKKVAALIGVTLPDTVIGVILYQLSIAESRYICSLCAPIWRVIRGCMFCIALVLGAMSTFICRMVLQAEGKTHWHKMLQPLLFGLAFSYITWFALWLIIPCQLGFLSNWCTEKNSGVSAAAQYQEEQARGAAE